MQQSHKERRCMRLAVFGLLLLIGLGSVSAVPYGQMLDAFYGNPAVVQVVNGGLWVPWYDTSTSCAVGDLHSGSSCNSGQTIDLQHNCMVTDEFSNVGIWTAYGNNQTRMDQFVQMVFNTNSSFGSIPAWRIYRDGSSIQACRSGVNGNCDTASDATARIIIALEIAGHNQAFSSSARSLYLDFAKVLADDMVQYEMVMSCYSTRYGQVCNWLAAGARAKQGGLASTDFGYAGYYPDAALAMFMVCKDTGSVVYCGIGNEVLLNYLQAAKFNGSFTASPGRSFKWDVSSGQPEAVCTNTCSPVQWDADDAARALGFCGAYGYAVSNNISLSHEVGQYCQLWKTTHMSNPMSVPIQLYPDGSATSPQSGFWAQGLAAMFYSGWDDQNRAAALQGALGHYSNGAWDSSACFGVYRQAPVMRMYGQEGFTPTVQNISQPELQELPAAINNSVQVVDVPVPQSNPVLKDPPRFDPAQYQSQPQSQGYGYVPSYEKSDLPVIVEDGIGVGMASVVDWIDIVVICAVLGFGAWGVAEWRKSGR